MKIRPILSGIFQCLLFVLLIFAAMLLNGCSTTPPQPEVRIVEVPSSKPYSYLRWSQQCPAPVNRGIRAHNRAHQRVIDAEKKARQ